MANVVTTTTVNRKTVWGDRRVISATLAFNTGDYTTGGIAVTASQFGLAVLEEVIPMGAVTDVAATPTALVAQWDATNSKIKLFEAAAAGASFTEKPAEAMGSGATCRVLVIGY